MHLPLKSNINKKNWMLSTVAGLVLTKKCRSLQLSADFLFIPLSSPYLKQSAWNLKRKTILKHQRIFVISPVNFNMKWQTRRQNGLWKNGHFKFSIQTSTNLYVICRSKPILSSCLSQFKNCQGGVKWNLRGSTVYQAKKLMKTTFFYKEWICFLFIFAANFIFKF